MAEKAALDVLRFQRFTQQRIGLEINHSKGEVFARTPISIDLFQFLEV